MFDVLAIVKTDVVNDDKVQTGHEDDYDQTDDDDYDPDHPDYQVASASSGGGGYQKTKSLRYEQFTSPIVKAIQELDSKVTTLTERVAALE